MSKQATDVTITESGTYTLSGEFKNSVIIDAEDEDYSNIDFNGYKLYVNGKAIN